MCHDFHYSRFRSPIGMIGLISFRGKLIHLLFLKTEKELLTKVLTQITATSGSLPVEDAGPFKYWRNLLDRYFCGERVLFNEPVDLKKGTVLQKVIWDKIAQIPYGMVQSYQDIANQLGMKKSARVVGGACGVNPIPIIIPCHRVVHQNGSLGGYRCGIKIKQELLAIEGTHL